MSATHTLPIDAVLPAWRVKLFGACAMWHGLVQTCCCSAELFAWLDNIVGFFQTHHQTHAICVVVLPMCYWECSAYRFLG
jgi:hypothetical protein